MPFVTSVEDGIVNLNGKFAYEIFQIFQLKNDITGVVFEATTNSCKLVLINPKTQLIEIGSEAKFTKHVLSVNLPKELFGRVFNAFGNPIDGLPAKTDQVLPVIKKPIPLMERQAVTKTLETGILAIDSAIPIGKGQRELIVGDRQTGKTAIALNTIINQIGKGVKCIYVSIGQKNTTAFSIIERLKKTKAINHTIVIVANSSDSVIERFTAPYSAMTIAEELATQGEDVLIVFDDLTKHAETYREMSLLLKRTPGREAYPGDIFFIHSSLLERAGAFSKKYNNGTITVFPIVETQDGEISSYIPTNVISITDGQLYMDKDLFLDGQLPAINIAKSVSRIGSVAQSQLIKEYSKNLKIDFSIYQELKIFSKFSKEMSDRTIKKISSGKTLQEIMKQGLDEHYTQLNSAILLMLYKSGILQTFINVEKIVKSIKEIINNESSFALLWKTIDLKAESSKIFAVIMIYFGPFLKAIALEENLDLSLLKEQTLDRRLFLKYYATNGGS